MTQHPFEARSRALALAGIDALRRGDAPTARDLLGRVVAAGEADVSILLHLAGAHRAVGDGPAEISILDRVLALDARNLHALILKGDHFQRRGDSRAASAFYLSALKASPPPAQLPQDLQAALQRAQTVMRKSAADYEAHLLSSLEAQGFGAGTSERFSESVELLLGRRKIYLQEPLFYYFPGLPQIQFYPRQQFPWMDAIEAATADIRGELRGILDQDSNAFSPYVEAVADRPGHDPHGMRGNPDWSALYLIRNGVTDPANAAHCPKTLAALENAPLCRITGRTPSVLFSQLRPGARIPPHNGFVNTRLICHLPLIVPDGCQFRVGNETRHWREGKAWAFDDTIEHEAWNSSDQTRIILLFDIWRPELSDEEQALVAAMMQAIDDYGGDRQDWSM